MSIDPQKRLPDIAIIRVLYVDEKKTLQEIGDIYQVSRERVRQVMNKAGIPRRKIRSDARCHYCHSLLSETLDPYFKGVRCSFCNEVRPPKYRDPYAKTTGRPRRQHPFGEDGEYAILMNDYDAPPWFQEAMLNCEKMLTVHQFAELFEVNPNQIRRWCEQGFIHCAWTDNYYYEPKQEIVGWDEPPKKKTNVKFHHYVYHLKEGQKGHRRIPQSEVERCQFLKARQRGCGRDPRFGVDDGVRRMGPGSSPLPKDWRERLHRGEVFGALELYRGGANFGLGELLQLGNEAKARLGIIEPLRARIESEPLLKRNPNGESEPIDNSKPLEVSEPIILNKPQSGSEPILMSKPFPSSDEIDLSLYEE